MEGTSCDPAQSRSDMIILIHILTILSTIHHYPPLSKPSFLLVKMRIQSCPTSPVLSHHGRVDPWLLGLALLRTWESCWMTGIYQATSTSGETNVWAAINNQAKWGHKQQILRIPGIWAWSLAWVPQILVSLKLVISYDFTWLLQSKITRSPFLTMRRAHIGYPHVWIQLGSALARL